MASSLNSWLYLLRLLERQIMFYQNILPQNSIHSIKHVYKHGIEEPEHKHRVIQLLHIIKGVIRVYAQNRCWVVPPSHGLLIPADISHSLIAVGNVDLSTLYIEPLARADLPNELGMFQVTPLLCELINTASSFDDKIAIGSREERINELILDELRMLQFTDFNVPMPTSKSLKAFCERLSNCYERPWKLTDVATSLSLSTRTVSRKFYNETGMTFGEWLRRYRLQKSMELMASGYSVTNAALAVGYDSQSSFSFTFKKRVGIPPSSFVGLPNDSEKPFIKKS